MKFLIAFLTAMIAATGGVSSQVNWHEVSAEFGPLPASVKVFRSNDSLNGRPFIAYYVVAGLKDRKLNFSAVTGNGNRYTPTQYYLQNDSPLLVVNSTFFSFETNQNLNAIIINDSLRSYNVSALRKKGTDSFYYPTRSAIGITKRRRADVAWLFTDTSFSRAYAFQRDPLVVAGKNPDPSFKDLKTFSKWRWWRVHTAVGGGPVLIHNREIRITNKEEQMFANGDSDRHPRTAIGYTAGRKLIILVIQGRNPGVAEGATLKEEAQLLLDLGCIEALNLDGGSSSSMVINGKQTIKPSDKGSERPVPAVFVISANL
ncbi:MAG: phosphodiester glycosidase family protein [Chitinophagaceae bacterium]|nr:MAG: phosphodiester glycosidase family protein [Chitinophagaceae bacterium]